MNVCSSIFMCNTKSYIVHHVWLWLMGTRIVYHRVWCWIWSALWFVLNIVYIACLKRKLVITSISKHYNQPDLMATLNKQNFTFSGWEINNSLVPFCRQKYFHLALVELELRDSYLYRISPALWLKFGSDVTCTSASSAFTWLHTIARAWSNANTCSTEIRSSTNTEQALILYDVTTKVLEKCRTAHWLTQKGLYTCDW